MTIAVIIAAVLWGGVIYFIVLSALGRHLRGR